MSVEIRYENNRMIFPIFDCDCGFQHHEPDLDVYIGSGILQETGEYIRHRNLGSRAVLVADNITYEVAGKYIEKLLREDGFRIDLCVLEREEELEPDERALGEVLLTIEQDTDFLIAVGSGSITDITRYVAFNTGRPFICVGTAASMDGYTSVIAPLLFNGLKVNKPASCPDVIICDIDIMKEAPLPMFIAGIGDVLGKYIAKADWVLGNIINGETYCPVCADIVMEAVNKCMSNIEDIKKRTESGTRILIEALILAGITILILGNTRPVASIEHNMGHYWEMMKLARGEKPASHGTAVGVGTIYSLLFYESFLQTDLSAIDKEVIKRNRLTREQRIERIKEGYGEKIGMAIIRDNPEDFLDWTEQGRRIDAVLENFDRIRASMEFLPSVDEMIQALQILGAPVWAHEIGVDKELLRATLQFAKDYRSRYNVSKTLEELGLLDEVINKILAI